MLLLLSLLLEEEKEGELVARGGEDDAELALSQIGFLTTAAVVGTDDSRKPSPVTRVLVVVFLIPPLDENM